MSTHSLLVRVSAKRDNAAEPRNVAKRIAIDGHPESFQLEAGARASSRIFGASLSSQVVVGDREGGAVLTRWSWLGGRRSARIPVIRRIHVAIGRDGNMRRPDEPFRIIELARRGPIETAVGGTREHHVRRTAKARPDHIQIVAERTARIRVGSDPCFVVAVERASAGNFDRIADECAGRRIDRGTEFTNP